MIQQFERTTIVAHGRLAVRDLRLQAARSGRNGLQIFTFEQLAARLSGGMTRPVDGEVLRVLVQTSLPVTELGELENLKLLPGMVAATVDTLQKAWRAGISLQERAGDHPRIAALAAIEAAVVDELPAGMMRPGDIVEKAMGRLEHARVIFGAVEIVGITELSPCWRPLLRALANHLPVRWIAGPRSVPVWLDASVVAIERSVRHHPETQVVSAATATHEAIEAVRWARALIVSGTAKPDEIAIATTSPSDYDDYFLSLRADANIDICFGHGVKATTSRDGQAAAALADTLVRGLSQTRMRRLSSLLSDAGPFKKLPSGWTRLLPSGAPLTSVRGWIRVIGQLSRDKWPDGKDHAGELRAIVDLLTGGTADAESAGEALLSGRALSIWRKALQSGPAASIDITIDAIRMDDDVEASTSIAWMPANSLAASPRRFVRLLGMNSSRWPRAISEDRLLSDHIVSTSELDPLPISAADRRDFETIIATTECQVVLSRSRRDSDGRLLGKSSLLRGFGEELYLSRNRIPDHAYSETDRLLARGAEFSNLPQGRAADICWRNWLSSDITPHDGLIRPNHPVIQAVLGRTQSASSLKQLLRNPIGFVWHYAFNWKALENGEDPLVLDALAIGNLVHLTLDTALRSIEANSSLSAATRDEILAAVDRAAAEVSDVWETLQAVPPRMIWQRTLSEAIETSKRALTYDDALPFARAFSEVPFGGATPKSSAGLIPWSHERSVEIPGTGLQIAGYIDRLDISGDGRKAMVRDYKTGREPAGNIVIAGGAELQRCLYGFAVKSLLGVDVEISASLLYPRSGTNLRLEDPEVTLEDLSRYLAVARDSLLGGSAILGADTASSFDDLAFALPANAGATYCKRKWSAAVERLGAATQVWEVA